MQRPTILVRLRSVMRSMILLMVWLLTSFTIWVVVVDFESTLIADNFMFWNTTKTTIRNVTLITARSCENMDYCKIVWKYGLLHDRVKIWTTAWSCENMDYCMIVWKYGLLHDRVKYGLLHDRVKIWTTAWSCENMDYCMIVWQYDIVTTLCCGKIFRQFNFLSVRTVPESVVVQFHCYTYPWRWNLELSRRYWRGLCKERRMLDKCRVTVKYDKTMEILV